jgi:hypothetical protein
MENQRKQGDINGSVEIFFLSPIPSSNQIIIHNQISISESRHILGGARYTPAWKAKS